MNRVLTREPQDWWNTVALGAIAMIVLLTIWFTACSSASLSSANKPQTKGDAPAATTASISASKPAGENVPTSLSNAGEYGENVYDYAKANDWQNADVKVAALKDAIDPGNLFHLNQNIRPSLRVATV